MTAVFEPHVTTFDDRVQLDAAVQSWLKATMKPGDMVLVGGATAMSRFIQRRLKSDYTHAALVTGNDSIAESYDYRLAMLKNDDGVTETSIDEFHHRHARVGTLAVFRPEGIDVAAVLEQIARYSQHQIPYPSAGMVVLAIAVTTARVAERQQAGSLRERTLRRLVTQQVKLAGDGDSYMHCAEYVTRVYWAAGLRLRFRQLTLKHDVDHPDLTDHIASQSGPDTATDYNPPGIGPSSGGVTKPKSAVAVIARSAPFALFDLCRALAQRHRDATPADLADVVFPPDLETATPMIQIGRIDVDRQALAVRSTTGALP